MRWTRWQLVPRAASRGDDDGTRAARTSRLDGQPLADLAAHSGQVVIARTFVGADPDDAESAARAAVAKVHHKLTSG